MTLEQHGGVIPAKTDDFVCLDCGAHFSEEGQFDAHLDKANCPDPIVVTNKRLWKGRYGTATPRIFVQIFVAALGLVIKNIVVSAKLMPPDQHDLLPLPLDGIFNPDDFDRYHVGLPQGTRYYPALTVDQEHWDEFRRNLLAAMNECALTQSPMTASMPPEDVYERLARATRRGKVPVVYTGLKNTWDTAWCIETMGRKPAWRWYEPQYGHYLSFIFPNQEAADAAHKAWNQELRLRGGRTVSLHEGNIALEHTMAGAA